MNAWLTKILFSCPACNRKLVAEPEEAGDRFKCPNCPAVMTIPGKAAQKPVASPAAVVADGTVPVEVSLPGIGSVGGRVTKEASGNILLAVVSGFLVLLTVMVCGTFGGNPPKKA